jgi:hypothetical protein
MRLTNLALLCFALGCSSSTPANFAGMYSATLVENADNCSLPGWMAGNSVSNIQLTFTQDGSTTQANVGGLAGLFIQSYIGTDTFSGVTSGNTFTATVLGQNSKNQTTCTYTVNLNISVTIDSNDNLSGTVTLTPQTNNDPACGVLNMCNNTETLSAARTAP